MGVFIKKNEPKNSEIKLQKRQEHLGSLVSLILKTSSYKQFFAPGVDCHWLETETFQYSKHKMLAKEGFKDSLKSELMCEREKTEVSGSIIHIFVNK